MTAASARPGGPPATPDPHVPRERFGQAQVLDKAGHHGRTGLAGQIFVGQAELGFRGGVDRQRNCSCKPNQTFTHRVNTPQGVRESLNYFTATMFVLPADSLIPDLGLHPWMMHQHPVPWTTVPASGARSRIRCRQSRRSSSPPRTAVPTRQPSALPPQSLTVATCPKHISGGLRTRYRSPGRVCRPLSEAVPLPRQVVPGLTSQSRICRAPSSRFQLQGQRHRDARPPIEHAGKRDT